MDKLVAEIFDEFKKAKNKQERIAVLRKYRDYKPLKGVLQFALNPKFKFRFIKPVDYKPSEDPVGFAYMNMNMALDRAYIFLQNASKVDDKRCEILLIDLLEALDGQEAEVYMNMILKNLKVKYLTYNLVREALPDLLPPPPEA